MATPAGGKRAKRGGSRAGSKRRRTTRNGNTSRIASQRGTFRSFIDAAPVMLWMSDGGDYKSHFNKAWLAFAGLSQEQAVGSGWLSSVHPDEREACASA